MRSILRHFSNYKVKTKLILLTGIFLVSIIILGSVVNLLFKTSQTLTILSSEQRVFVESLGTGIEHFYNYELSDKNDMLQDALGYFDKSYKIAYNFSKIDSIVSVMPAKEWMAYLYPVYKDGVAGDINKIKLMGKQINLFSILRPNMLKDIQSVAIEAAEKVQNASILIQDYQKEKTREKLVLIQSEFDKIHKINDLFALKIHSLSEYLIKFLFLLIFALVIILGIVVTLISQNISNSISVPVSLLADNFKKIANGDLKSSVDIDSKNEIGDLSRAFLKIQVGLQDIIFYSKKVAEGDFSSKLEPKSDNDELAVSLNKMAEKLEEVKLKTEKENWIQKGINGLDDEMRGNSSVRELSGKIVNYLSNFLEFEIGALYVYDEVLEHLELTGSTGLNLNELQKIIQIGEGLIGKAAQQHSLQELDTKNKYHKVFSASGEMIPEKIFILPVHFNGQIQAVLEIASINEISAIKIDFLKIIADKISVNLNASVVRYRNKELLDKTLEQAQILQTREEDLRKNLLENKLIQEKLVQEKALLDSMLQTIPDYVYFKDLNSKFLRISESMVHLFEVNSAEKIIGKSDFDFHTKQNAKKYFDEEQLIIKERKGFIDDVREGIDENENVLWTSVTKLPMFDETGKCIGTFGISKNVTKIKQLETEVKEQYQKLKEKQDELSILNNELFLQQEELKTTNEELKSQEEELRVANEELAEQTKILSKSEKSLQVQQEELKVTNEELEMKTNELELQKKEISEKNKTLELARKELEQKAKELELASKYKSEFLANMSHELRTPLNSLLILSKLLENNKDGNLTEDQVKSANIIYKSGKDLLELINEILDLSKIEAGKMNFEFNTIRTDDIKTEILNGFKPVAETKGLSFELISTGYFPETIYTDKQRLLQIIKNILSNAFKFTSNGSIKVIFGVPAADVTFVNQKLNKNNTCFISVEDTGVGIPKNKFDAIFEAFQQADGSISRRYGGTGLGLSISRELIRVLGGEIHVESTENVGSAFTVFLPLDQNLTGNISDENDDKQLNKTAIKDFNINSGEETENGKNSSEKSEIPVFIDDDRDAEIKRTTILIIHPEKEKANELLSLCHKKNFDAVVAENISNGLKLAELHAPKAIIISEELNNPKEYEKLKINRKTSLIPIHHVSRIEDISLNDFEDLKTPSTSEIQSTSKNIENKLTTEFNQVLIVEDDPSTQQALHLLLKNKNLIIHEAKTGKQAFDMISTKWFDCIILDLGLPDFSGKELLEKLNAEKIPLPYIIIHTASELSKTEIRELSKYSESIVIKGVKSDDRLMDEVSIFLHHIENKQQKNPLSATYNLSATPVFKGKKILLVDDDIRNIFALAQILEEKEIEVFEAENGEVALEVLRNNKSIDLILMDIMMPVMDGYETMKIIRETRELKNIPIITLTAKAMKEDYQKAIDSGANDYISKPLDVDKLFELLKIWLFK